LHYISSKWGIPREEIVAAMRSGHYKGPSTPHIHIHKSPEDKVADKANAELDAEERYD
jgi:hypothetical protein